MLYFVNFLNRHHFIFVNFFPFVVKWSISPEDDVIFVPNGSPVPYFTCNKSKRVIKSSECDFKSIS